MNKKELDIINVLVNTKFDTEFWNFIKLKKVIKSLLEYIKELEDEIQRLE